MKAAGTFRLSFNRHGAAPLVWSIAKLYGPDAPLRADAAVPLRPLWEIAVPFFRVDGALVISVYAPKPTPDDEDGRPSAYLQVTGELEVHADGSATIRRTGADESRYRMGMGNLERETSALIARDPTPSHDDGVEAYDPMTGNRSDPQPHSSACDADGHYRGCYGHGCEATDCRRGLSGLPRDGSFLWRRRTPARDLAKVTKDPTSGDAATAPITWAVGDKAHWRGSLLWAQRGGKPFPSESDCDVEIARVRGSHVTLVRAPDGSTIDPSVAPALLVRRAPVAERDANVPSGPALMAAVADAFCARIVAEAPAGESEVSGNPIEWAAVAARLSAKIESRRPTDPLARYGAEQFITLHLEKGPVIFVSNPGVSRGLLAWRKS